MSKFSDDLYRGKTIEDNKWVYGYYVNCASEYEPENRVAEIIEINADRIYDGEYSPRSAHPVIPETVGRCSGCKDIEGELIFSDDYVDINEDVKKTFDVKNGVVRYGRGGFYVNEFNPLNSLNTLASYDWIFRGRVIGNIHDNPELKGEK